MIIIKKQKLVNGKKENLHKKETHQNRHLQDLEIFNLLKNTHLNKMMYR